MEIYQHHQTKQGIFQLKNTFVCALWWINYAIETLFSR